MSIHKKLQAIQQELNAPKNQRNNFGNYNYRSAEDILEALKPLLSKQDCILTLFDELVNIGDRYYIKATARLADDEGYQASFGYAREEESKKGMDGSQITGACSSYARKYALNGLFLIDDNKDSDATNTHGKAEWDDEPMKAMEDALKNMDVVKCKQCGADAKFKTGNKNGKQWKAYFCSKDKNHVEWVR